MKVQNMIARRIDSMYIAAILLALLLPCAGQKQARAAENAEKRAWAEKITLPHAENFFRVTDKIYRSAQPSPEAMREYEKFGIRTVVNLRSFHSDEDDVVGTRLKLIEIPVNTWNIDDQEVVATLRILNEDPGPILLHCQHGADRTGLMIAAYRILFQNWSKAEALDELRDGGFGYHTIWINIPDYIKNMDVEKMRARVK